jgi:hypothetical protein
MQLDAVRTITNGATDPDPGVASTISAGLVFATRTRQPSSDVPNTVLVLALEAPSSETVTVDLYAVFEDTAPPQSIGDLPGAVPSSRFYLFASGVVVTGSQLLARQCFLGGQIYARVTSDTLTVPRKLRATCSQGTAASAGATTAITAAQLPAALGRTNAAGSLSVVLASDDHMKGQAGGIGFASAAEAANTLNLARYLAAPPTLTDGQVQLLLADALGNLKVAAINGLPTKTNNQTYITAGNMAADIDGDPITVGPEGRLVMQLAWSNTGSPIGLFVIRALMPDGSTYEDIPGSSAAFLRHPNADTNTSMVYERELQAFTSVKLYYRRTSGGTANTSLVVKYRTM